MSFLFFSMRHHKSFRMSKKLVQRLLLFNLYCLVILLMMMMTSPMSKFTPMLRIDWANGQRRFWRKSTFPSTCELFWLIIVIEKNFYRSKKLIFGISGTPVTLLFLQRSGNQIHYNLHILKNWKKLKSIFFFHLADQSIYTRIFIIRFTSSAWLRWGPLWKKHP